MHFQAEAENTVVPEGTVEEAAEPRKVNAGISLNCLTSILQKNRFIISGDVGLSFGGPAIFIGEPKPKSCAPRVSYCSYGSEDSYCQSYPYSYYCSMRPPRPSCRLWC
ncbi:hypothetical protein ILUMI_12770 [Ignelater luminosus]|uniref:Uncharacterized protein n=1 Tax=Ignelater luminosus TaxID=2038154 RepID=A0A8K0CXG5_IGNLU|nr:hypothetical protein ILUMI_12770 [Ignelater luminosus]